MNPVFTLGVECRHLPATTHTHEGESIAVPAHWTTVAVFGGIDSRGIPRMWQALPGIISRDDSMEAAREVLNRTLHHFPIDGQNLQVGQSQVWSVADRRLGTALKAYHLWVPPKDVFWQGPEVAVYVEGQVVGGGVGLEWHEGVLYLAPYLAVVVEEEFSDGRTVSMTVPVRWMAPLAPKSAVVKGDAPLREFIPQLHAKLRSQGPIGAHVTLEIVGGANPHYSLVEMQMRATTTMGTALGTALAAAGMSTTDSGAGCGVDIPAAEA